MADFIGWYDTQAMQLHPVERAARVHGEFVKIHPFVDGNGWTSRLLMNLELMKAGFPAAVLSVQRRLEYYEALDRAHCHDDYAPFLTLIAAVVVESFDPYWWALGVKA
ncbi:Fic family protein [Thiothrix fructosivorans]|nr:Fic family protein [Thiothrix fructosivorans]